MTQATSEIRITKVFLDDAWPIRTQAVSYVGDTCVVEGVGDFDLDDLQYGAPLPGPVGYLRRPRDHRVAPPPPPDRREDTSSMASRNEIRSPPTPRRPVPDEATGQDLALNTRDPQRPREPNADPERVRTGRANTHGYKSTSGFESDRIRPALYG
jgi:hypothetical protein